MKGMILAGAGSLLLAGSAFATGDMTFDLGTHTLGGGEMIAVDLDLGQNAKGITGFTVNYDYSEPVADGSWASDVQVRVSGGGASYVVGGFDQTVAPDTLWAFDGPGSDGDGNYGETFLPWADAPAGKGMWHVEFENDWGADANPNVYANITITFHKAPAPGALALLGLAGVASRRRRR